MLDHIRAHTQLILLILLWFVVTRYGGPLIYGLLPISVFALRGRDQYPDILFGFLMILVLSDMDPMFVDMRKIKSAKYAMMVAISLVILLDRKHITPLAGVFTVFAPFFIYAFLPIANGNDPITGVSKTISYGLLYLVIPNYVLHNFRLYGWDFIRNLIFFILLILLASYAIYFISPRWVSIAGRYRAFFGNPNGLGIFCFLVFMLITVVLHLNKEVFSFREKVFVYGVVVFFLVQCGSRTSITSTLMFLVFSRFFGFSPFIGFVTFIVFLFIAELVSNNLAAIVIGLGLQEYFRVETLDDGSGRYFAWSFAWQKINEDGYFLFGGGFGNDEWVMRHNYPYLRSQGHHGGVHNSYLTMWFNTGIIGVLIYFRSFFLIFFKANKRVPIAFAIMFATMFSILYESWLTGSLNPFTILLVTMLTLITEDEIVDWRSYQEEADGEEGVALEGAPVPVPST